MLRKVLFQVVSVSGLITQANGVHGLYWEWLVTPVPYHGDLELCMPHK